MRAVLWLASVATVAQTLPGDRVIAADAAIGSVSFSADGTTIAGSCEDGRLRVWDAATGILKRTFSLDNGDGAVTFSDRADLLATAGRDGGIKIWDVRTGVTTRRFAAPAPAIRHFVFSPDSKRIAGAVRDRDNGSEFTVRIWDTEGAPQLSMAAGLGGVSAMAFSPDGRTLVAAGYDTNLRAWNTRDGELLRLMEELPLSMFAVAFSPDGKYLATAGADRIVYLWDTRTWKIARKLSGQPEMISAVAFSPDSRLLLTGGFSEFTLRNPVKILLWDLTSDKVRRSMPSAHMVRSTAFSPDGTRAATANIDQTINIWSIPPAPGR